MGTLGHHHIFQRRGDAYLGQMLTEGLNKRHGKKAWAKNSMPNEKEKIESKRKSVCM
jgi:hypothetical protein